MAADCKSAGLCPTGVRIPPCPLSLLFFLPQEKVAKGLLAFAGVAQWLEHLPSKQDVVGSSPIARYGFEGKLPLEFCFKFAAVAQW